MKWTRILPGMLSVLVLSGLASVVTANEWDAFYRQHPNHQGEFTNSQAWAGFIVALGPDGFDVVRYGETVRIRLREGNPPLFVGQRVRMVPFARDGGAEVAELRLPDEGYRPVGVVRYGAFEVPRERPPAAYGYEGGGRPGFGFQAGGRPRGQCRPPASTYRPPPTFRQGRWGY